jgi:hypothetical protein
LTSSKITAHLLAQSVRKAGHPSFFKSNLYVFERG